MGLTVATFLWSDPGRRRAYTFSHDHVRILRNMVARNLSLPHRFVCVTDDEIDDIETVPLDWTMHLPGTCYVKLQAHRPGIEKQLGDRIFLLDLDIVVTGSLDAIVDDDAPIKLWRNPNFPTPGRAFYQGSVRLFDADARPGLWTEFNPRETPKWVNWRFGGAEQAWISEHLPWDEAYWDHRDGIYGAGRVGDWSNTNVVNDLPADARIVSFPGNRIPSDAEAKAKFPWIEEHYR